MIIEASHCVSMRLNRRRCARLTLGRQLIYSIRSCAVAARGRRWLPSVWEEKLQFQKEDSMKKVSVIALVALAFCVSSALAADTLWTRTYSGPGANMDQGRAVATIGTDIYVTGQEMTPSEPNVLVVKYHANGDTAWARTFNLDTMEQPVDIAVGSDSGPVVCVSMLGMPPAFRVIKLDKDGDTVWTRRRNGVQATNLALDDDGNVFVLGAAFGTMPNESLYLGKYTPAGAQDWQKTFVLGTNHQTGGACCDASGNILGVVSFNAQNGPFSGCIKFSPYSACHRWSLPAPPCSRSPPTRPGSLRSAPSGGPSSSSRVVPRAALSRGCKRRTASNPCRMRIMH